MLVATIATGAKFTTKKKLGIATCAEAQACRDAYDQWPDVARRFGLDLVYRAQVSLAQPDFTAECLGARNAGVELFATVVDVTGVSRFSASCGRQNFKPTYLFIQTVVDDREKNDPNLQGAYGAVATFPWPADDSPGTAEYHATMRRFAPNVTPAASSTQLWTAAKIFERAAVVLADPPDRGKLIDTLHSLKNETFGGLTQPITYHKDAAASRVPCWFVQTISNGAWVAPQGSRPVCP
jgi:branched-chain amino acid transport system substrate-binding protein